MNRRRHSGFTLIELLVVVAVIGALTGIALPLYNGYMKSVQIAAVSYHYDEAIRVASTTQARNHMSLATGAPPVAPTTSSGWIELFDKDGAPAPGGGPAYIPGETGDSLNGAVGVAAVPDSYHVILTRPAYLGLDPYRAEIRDGNITYVTLPTP